MRAYRKGIEKTIKKGESLIIWDLIAKGTQDIKLINALRNKKDLSKEILRDPENFFLLPEKED